MTKRKLGLPRERRMVRAEFHDGLDTHGAGESGVAAALPPSLRFGAAGCHRSPRRFALLNALGDDLLAGVPRCCGSQTRAPFASTASGAFSAAALS